MLKQHARAIDLGIRVLDLVLLVGSLLVAHAIYAWPGFHRPPAPALDRLGLPLVATVIVWIIASAWSEVYASYRISTITAEVARISRALLVVSLLTATLAFGLKNHDVPRILAAMFFIAAWVLMASSRVVLRSSARILRRRGRNTRRYAVVGSGPGAARIASTFEANPQWGFALAGYILPEGVPWEPTHGAPVLGHLGELEQILDDQVLDEVVFAVRRESLFTIEGAVRLCEEQGVAVVVSLEPLRIGTGKMSLFELSDQSMLVFSRTPSDAVSLGVKRVLDMALSAAVLLALSPLFLVVALAIKLDSRGPVFFRQRRVGRNGRPFTILKFRSMDDGAEKGLEALRDRNEMNGPTFKMRNDPRITSVGRWLRRTSVDELPQFWNVLKGEMSIVGPRPPIPAEVRQYKRWQRRRLSMRPGITCTWQVSGRSNIDFDDWMELDLAYIDNWSLWRDVEICLRTIPAVISTRGAH